MARGTSRERSGSGANVARYVAHATRDLAVPLAGSHRRREPRGRVLVMARLTLLAAFAISALTFAIVVHSDHARDTGWLPDTGQALAWLGLGIDEAVVQGQQMTADSEIFDALDLINARSWLSFDSRAARARIERLAWVRTATVSRVFPGRIEVRVGERTPAAVWRQDDRDMLIDGSGRVLAAVARGAAPHLPRVAGEGAPAEAARILALVASYPMIESRLASAELVAERRWTLHLEGGAQIWLPAEAGSQALARFMGEPGAERLLEAYRGEIDLRVTGRVGVRVPSAHR